MNVSDIDAASVRSLTDGVRTSDQFPARWSPRAMSGEPVATQEIDSLLEAARWAPSCFNAQPWRFAVIERSSDAWPGLFGTLVEGNQSWVQAAGAIIAIISRTRYEHNDQPAPTHSFDAGAAWMSLALQARELGLVAHGMRGFDLAAARAQLRVPEQYDLPCLVAIGRPGVVSALPEAFAAKESPSARKPLSEIAFRDSFEGVSS